MTPKLTLIPGDGAARGDGGASRDDVVRSGGRLALVNSAGLPPAAAQRDDLLALKAALEGAGIEYLLVRGDGDRPVLAVDVREREAVERAFAEAFADEPFTAKAMDRTARSWTLLADGTLSSHRKARVFRVFRPRLAPHGTLRYGAAVAPQLELWTLTPEEVVAPRPNAIMRERMPRADLADAVVERFGESWPTIAGMWEPLASDVDFEVDLVFSWVDGTDAEFQRARAKRMAAYVVGEGDDSEARFRQIDELKYAMRSVHLYAPWIRHIYIATDSPRPTWLAEHPDVTIVPSEAMFRDTSVLPTHNSHAVESQLHRIPGLSEYFLYSNDDMFFGRPVRQDMFFSPGGITRFIEAELRIGLGDHNPARSGYENAARNNRRLLRERFGRITTRHLEHVPVPFRKSVFEQVEREFQSDFDRTAAARFRSASDISVTNSLYHYWALMTGHAVVQERFRFTYVETTLQRAAGLMRRLLRDRDNDFFCLNDGSFPEIEVEERTANVREFLEAYFPIPAPWEVQAQVPSASPRRTDALSAAPGSGGSSAPRRSRAGSPARG